MIAMIHFDNLHYIETLKAAGVSDKKAKAFARAQQDVFSDCSDTTLATKADLGLLKVDFGVLKADLKEVESKLSWKIGELKSDIKVLQSEMTFVKWTLTTALATLIAGVGSLIFKAFS